ncbi:hypothetical protein GCM10022222_45750 [Amycolatopsis ultiminotia]|uniref:BD-FAE-like domain-containing protein n=1 Tax=Amycolatopsis ultiminotia TaxID=543629 RepID=A0ABP6WX78_9PSEU
MAQNATRLGVDANGVTLAGNSAGGNLALLAAYTVGTGQFPPSCGVPERAARAVIASYAPTDTADQSSGVPSIADDTGATYFGGTPQQVPEAYRATSPITYVRPGLPPTLLLPFTEHVFDRFWNSWGSQISYGVTKQFLDAPSR